MKGFCKICWFFFFFDLMCFADNFFFLTQSVLSKKDIVYIVLGDFSSCLKWESVFATNKQVLRWRKVFASNLNLSLSKKGFVNGANLDFPTLMLNNPDPDEDFQFTLKKKLH